MATYLRLFDPTQQFQLRNGALNVSGRLYVYLEGTDDYADLYAENGSQLQQPVVLDNNGRSAGLFVDSKKTYWMKVNDQYDGTIFTIRKMTPCGGGGGSVLSGTYNVVSTDGSIAIDKSVDAGNTTFDLTKPSDSTELLEWFRSDSYYKLPDTNIYRPSCTKGTMETGDVGVQILAHQYYHVTGHIWASKDEGREPFYDEITIKYMLRGEGLYDKLVMSSKVIVDYSLGLSQEFEVSTDVIPDEDCELYVVIENQSVNNGYFGLKDMEIHRIFSGSPAIPSGVLSRARAAEIYQRKLIAGQNITITETEEGDIIASTGGGGGGGGATYQGGDGIIVNNTTYRISIDNSVVQEKLIAGDNITIDEDNVISATVPSVDISGKADKVENAVNGNLAGLDATGNLTDSGIAADRVVTDPSYVHTDNNFTNELKNKLINIEAGAEVNVQSDWTESDSSSDAFIKNKPDLSNFATLTDLDGKADKVSGATAGNLAGLDATGNLTDSGVSAQNIVHDASYVHTDNNFTNTLKDKLDGIEAGAEVNVQSDWNQADTLADDYIKNKPQNLVQDANYVHTDNNFTNIYKAKLDGIESGAEVNVQADWDETDITSDAFIKNKPEVLANKDLVAGTNITLVQTANNVVISAQYAGGTYDTQQISAGNHIIITSDAEISTDLSDSGELAAWYQVAFNTNWGTTAAFDNAGSAISASNTYENVLSTTSIVVDDTFGSNAQNELANIISGSLLLRNGYVYHIEFNSNGIIEPPASLADTAYMRATIQKADNEYMTSPTHVVSSSYEKTASCLHVHCDLVGDNHYGAIFLHNVKNQSGGTLDATVRAYPTITVIARKK